MSNEENTRTVVRVIGSVSMEKLVVDLTNQIPTVSFTFQPIENASLESQQMDEAAREELLQNLKEELEENLNGGRPTGALQLFLLNDDGVAAGDPDSQATLRALAKAALSDPDNTVAALLPENSPNASELPSSLPEAVRSVVREFLNVKKVPMLNTSTELSDYFSNLNK